LFIDHGSGVVIGETAELGDDVTIYQGVTLGGTGKETGKRHPTIGNNVMIGAGAKVLGPFKVGDNSRIAAGAVVLDEIPPNSTAVGVPARVVKVNGTRISPLDQIHILDPVSQELCRLQFQVEQLQKKLEENKPDENL
jgi:serine O-acetyltransferase